MPIAVLQTKLYIPLPRPDLVPRTRLIEQIRSGTRGKLTLISAPAGFGKTTLVSEWVAEHSGRVAWLSLDEGDGEPNRFLTYVVAALRSVEPGLGEEVLRALQSPQPPPYETLLTTLLNEIAALPNAFAAGGGITLVLDDYHALDARAIDEALLFLLEHLPPQLHLILTTRADPAFPLARFRARGQLTEIRAADLRFISSEAAQFLNGGMGLKLSEEEIAALETRTEGWIAGLQMAALSMQGRRDTTGFIDAFTGSHRFVLDYLLEEVLQNQPDAVRTFLLQTAILERLCGPLCDAVTGRGDSQRILTSLERANLFVVPLDDERHWYRYHHLFADVLRARLAEGGVDRHVPTLHQRASLWCEQNGLHSDAIRHAFAAEDFERAADLLERTWPVLVHGFLPATWLQWVQSLPDELIRARPVLCTGAAWTLADGGELEAAEMRLDHAERWLGRSDEDADVGSMIVANETEFRSLPATIASARAYIAQARSDVPATVRHAGRALELLAEDAHYWRGTTAMFLGMAYWTRGDLDAAHSALAQSVANLHKADNTYLQMVGTVMLGDIRTAQGSLAEATALYESALQIARSDADAANLSHASSPMQDEPPLHGTVNLYVGLSDVAREQGKLDAADQYLLRGKALGTQSVSPGSAYRLYTAMARVKESHGDWDGALELLRRAERQYKRDAIPHVRPAAALRARLWIRQGKLAEAWKWAHAQGVAADGELSYLREFEHVTLARLLLAEHQLDGAARALQQATELLLRLLHAAQAGGRMGSVIEILMLQALALRAQGNGDPALAPLEQALALAEPRGYVQLFVDEGRPMQTLLAESLARGGSPTFITDLLARIRGRLGEDASDLDANQLLVEPLSERELEVLRLVASGLTNQAVADELIIALSTVKKHVNSIYGKLGVGNRTQAVRRARELDLLQL